MTSSVCVNFHHSYGRHFPPEQEQGKHERYEEGVESRLHAAAYLCFSVLYFRPIKVMASAKALLFEHQLPQFRSTPLLRPVMRICVPPSHCSSIFCGPYCSPILPFAKRRDVVAGDGGRGMAMCTYVSLSPPSMRSCAARNAASILQTYFNAQVIGCSAVRLKLVTSSVR